MNYLQRLRRRALLEGNIQHHDSNIPDSDLNESVSNLQRVFGIGPEFEKRLKIQGVMTLIDLANLTEERILEIEKVDSMTSLEQWSNWIDQARNLIS